MARPQRFSTPFEEDLSGFLHLRILHAKSQANQLLDPRPLAILHTALHPSDGNVLPQAKRRRFSCKIASYPKFHDADA
jgi:hypothetical protein